MTEIRPPPRVVVEVICSRDDFHKLMIFISQHITHRFDSRKTREVDSDLYRYEVILEGITKNQSIAKALVDLAARTVKLESDMEDRDTAIDMMVKFIQDHNKATT